MPPGMGSRLHGNDGCVWGVTLTPALSRRGRGGRRAAGDGFPFARERRLAWGVTLTPSRERGTACRRGWVPASAGTTVGMGSHPHSFEGEGDGVAPGMGSRLHGNDGWHGESPSPQPSPVEGEGDGVPPGMGSRLHGNDGWHGESPSPQPSPVKEEGDGVPPGMGSRLHGNDGLGRRVVLDWGRIRDAVVTTWDRHTST